MSIPTSTQAVTVSARTAEQVLGLSWRTIMKLAQQHGVPILGAGRHRIIEVAPLLAALKTARPQPRSRPLEELSDEEQREELIRRLGLRRVAR